MPKIFPISGTFTVLLLLVVLLSGCDRKTETEPDKMKLESGALQTGIAGDVCDEKLAIELVGPKRPGLLGGEGKRLPVADVPVIFEPVDPDSGIEIVGDNRVTTDSGGHASVEVRLGDRFGDQYIKAYVEGEPDIRQTFRLVSGVVRKDDRQETLAGNELSRPLSITVVDEEGEPRNDVAVYFTIVNTPGKNGGFEEIETRTDADGVARANFTTDPDDTGRYEIMAEVVDTERGLSVRGIPFEVMSLNRLHLIVGVLGGLGIFIFGMRLMSDGLRQVAGSRLKSFLHFFTRNRVMAVIAGTLATGLMQSSSATTVMVVGFVNAGLIGLRQAVGVVFGANIGTTVTAQIISLNIKELALPAIAVGVALTMLARRSRTRWTAQAILGFGLLFLGMTIMSNELKGIADFPSFEDMFKMFDCTPQPGGVMPIFPVLGAVAIGAVMTVLVQSSSATIGIAIALASSGLINFYTAVPFILGDNIGTTVTALLASLGTNRSARQSAIAHTVFNVLGASYMIVLFYVTVKGNPIFLHITDFVTRGDVFAANPENIGRHIATAHTLFNVFNVLLFLPLIPAIVWLCNRILPLKKEQIETVPLEPHLLDTPAIAIDQSVNALVKMTETGCKLTEDCVRQLGENRIKNDDELRQREESLDQMQHDTIQYLTELTRRSLTEQQSKTIRLYSPAGRCDADFSGSRRRRDWRCNDRFGAEQLGYYRYRHCLGIKWTYQFLYRGSVYPR
ncbi:MAG: Na/Pi symporter [Lentisphaeria bacterium]